MNVSRRPVIQFFLLLVLLAGCAPSGSGQGSGFSATPSGIGDTSDGSVDVPSLRTEFWPAVTEAFRSVGCFRDKTTALPRGFVWLSDSDAFLGFASRDLANNAECTLNSRDCLFKIVHARFSVARCSEVQYREGFFFATREERENWIRTGGFPRFSQICTEGSVRLPSRDYFCDLLPALQREP